MAKEFRSPPLPKAQESKAAPRMCTSYTPFHPICFAPPTRNFYTYNSLFSDYSPPPSLYLFLSLISPSFLIMQPFFLQLFSYSPSLFFVLEGRIQIFNHFSSLYSVFPPFLTYTSQEENFPVFLFPIINGTLKSFAL